jgi:hypothetical protein
MVIPENTIETILSTVGLRRRLPIILIATSYTFALVASMVIRKHRTDLLKGEYERGNPMFWNVRWLDSRNYNADGKRLLKWVYLAILIFITGGILL